MILSSALSVAAVIATVLSILGWGLRTSPWATRRLVLQPDGKLHVEAGAFSIPDGVIDLAATRVFARSVVLAAANQSGGRTRRILITRSMVGSEAFRELKAFLRIQSAVLSGAASKGSRAQDR